MKQRPSKTILQASALHFGYPNRQLFTNFSTDIPPGITLVRGGDGRGKSTLLRLLAGVLPMQSGQLSVNDVDVKAHLSKDNVFWAEPRSEAFDQLTALDYFQLQRSRYACFDDAVLADMTDGLGLPEHLHKQLFMLSTGSKRKVFLAAAFASGAVVTLLDEPFAALDTASIGFIVDWLLAIASETDRAWVIADYVAPSGLPLAQIIDLGD